MINIFNDLYTLFVSALAQHDPAIQTDGVHVNKPSTYPFASLEEIDNGVYEATSDSCNIENHADIHFEVNIYTKGSTRKSKGDGIAQAVDNFFNSKGFVRQTKNVFQGDSETYQIIIRYRGIVSKDEVVYRR